MQTDSAAKKNIAAVVMLTAPWRAAKVKPLRNYRLAVEFIDGTCGLVEMQQLIMSPKAGVFANLCDVILFNQVYLEYGVVTWPGEIDLAPDAIYDAIKRNGIYTLH